ncbi:MAG: PaaI family thioesterase [Solirubrobacterales bacterium]
MTSGSSDTKVTPESLAEMIIGHFPGDLGIEPLEVSDERTVARMVVDERHLHEGGYVQGGAWVGLADSVAAWQTYQHVPAGTPFSTIELKLNLFAAAGPGDELVATAEHLHKGRTTHVVEVRVTRDDKVIANLIATNFIPAR